MIQTDRTSTSLEYTDALAAGFGACLRPGDIVELEGGLGAGKTTFTRAVAGALGAAPGLVSSPTFVFVNVYPCRPISPRPDPITRLIHVDAYRLTGPNDLDALGWDTLFEADGSRALGESAAMVEWPERIAGAFAPSPARVAILALGAEARAFRFALPETWRSRAGAALFVQREPIRCATTGKWVSSDNPSYPFSDERARMADLNRWFTGAYAVSREVREDDEGDNPLERRRGGSPTADDATEFE